MSTNAKHGEVRFSNLKHMAKSAAHYAFELRAEDSSTPAMQFGTLVHHLVLGSPQRVTVYDGMRRGKAWDAFRAANPTDLIITVNEHDRARAAADAVMRDPHARTLVEESVHERELFWEVGGRACGGRLDMLGADFIADLKTTPTAHPEQFTRHAMRMHYHAQLDWYAEGARRSKTADVGALYTIAVETRPPYAVTVHRMTERLLLDGRKRWMAWLEQLRVAEATDRWPAYVDCVVDMDMPDEGGLELIIADDTEAA